MTATALQTDRWDTAVDAFQRDGFVVIPDALSPAQVATL